MSRNKGQSQLSRPDIKNNGLGNVANTMHGVDLITGGSQLASYATIAHNNNYSLITQDRMMLTYLYSSNPIVQTVVDLPVQDALSRGIKIMSQNLSADDIEELQTHMDQSGMWTKLRRAWSWGRLYGGGALLINTNDKSEKPLRVKSLYNAPMEYFAVDRWQLNSANGAPEDGDQIYDIDHSDLYHFQGIQVHKSKVLLARGRHAPSHIRRILRGWGMSEVERMIAALNLFDKTNNSLYEIIDEAKVDVYKLNGLNQNLSNAQGEASIIKHLTVSNTLKSATNAIVLDKDDDYDQKSATFSGLAEVQKDTRIQIASAVRMPLTKLFGITASGFNSGESDLESYNSMVESDIREPMIESIRSLIELNMWQLWGEVVPFTLEWPSLRLLSAQEEEAVKSAKFDRAIAAYEHGLMNSKEWGEYMQVENIFPITMGAAENLLEDFPTLRRVPLQLHRMTPAGIRLRLRGQNDKITAFLV